MKKTTTKILLLFVITFIISFTAAYAYKGITLPKNSEQSFAYDETNTLSYDTKQYIENINKALEKTGAQIAVAVIDNLEGNDIETYANELFRYWGIGNREKNNGILLLISLNDKKMRIEVGYGLEGAIPDGKAGNIIRNVITPHFKNGDFDTGVLEGTKAILALVQQEYNIQIDKNVSVEDYNYKDKIKIRFLNNMDMGDIVFIIIIIIAIISGGNNKNKKGRKRRIWINTSHFGGGGFGGGNSGGGGFGGGSSGGGGASGGW